jgi:hypothetical protein
MSEPASIMLAGTGLLILIRYNRAVLSVLVLLIAGALAGGAATLVATWGMIR